MKSEYELSTDSHGKKFTMGEPETLAEREKNQPSSWLLYIFEVGLSMKSAVL